MRPRSVWGSVSRLRWYISQSRAKGLSVACTQAPTAFSASTSKGTTRDDGFTSAVTLTLPHSAQFTLADTLHCRKPAETLAGNVNKAQTTAAPRVAASETVTADLQLTATLADAQPTHPAVFPATTSSQSHKPTEALASKIYHCELSSRTPYVCHPQTMCELRSLGKITKVIAETAN
jgi:hypothetical protein